MKIIKEGHHENRMQVKCTNCKAELELNSGDIKWEKSLASVWGDYYYECPCCNAKHYLETKEMTRGVYKNLKRFKD